MSSFDKNVPQHVKDAWPEKVVTDPAVEAAQRVYANKTSGTYFTGKDVEAGAREALAPLKKRWIELNKNASPGGGDVLDELAPLIFSSEEMGK